MLQTVMTNITDAEDTLNTEIICLLCFLLIYAVGSAFLEHRRLPIHRGSVAIIIGVIIGGIFKSVAPGPFSKVVLSSDNIIFSVLFPPLIFTQGFSFHKNAMLKNMHYVFLFGVLGTTVSFFITSLSLQLVNSWGIIRDANDLNIVRTLDDWEILALAACFCSIDTGIAEETVDEEKHPRLWSIIFGESVMKDTVAIVLFREIIQLEESNYPQPFSINASSAGTILGEFLGGVLGAIAFGILFGVMTTLLFRCWRFVSVSGPPTSICTFFLLGYMTYLLAETLDLSGVIAILIYGVFLNRFNSYNISEKLREEAMQFKVGSFRFLCQEQIFFLKYHQYFLFNCSQFFTYQQLCSLTFQSISTICQGVLFLLMGIMAWQVEWSNALNSVGDYTKKKSDHMSHSWLFCLVTFVVLIISRLISTYGLYYFARLIRPKSFKLVSQELFIVFISGLVFGAVPFALFTSVSVSGSEYSKNEGLVLKTTVIVIVILSSVILNTLLPTIISKSLKLLEDRNIEANEGSHEQLTLPEHQSGTGLLKNKRLSKYRKLEQKIIKPLLIYNYENRKEELSKRNDRPHHNKEGQSIISGAN